MNSPSDLFADQGPEFAPQPDRLEVVAGKVVATMNKPSAAQKRFNTLMARIDAEQAMAGRLRQALDAHAPRHRHALQEIHTQSQSMCKRMVETLDARIQVPNKPKGLTANQKQQAIRIVLSLCEQLAVLQDPEVQAVWARYARAEEGTPDQSEQAKLEAQELLASFLGEDFAQGRTFDSPEDVLRAAMEFEQQKHQAQEEKRAAKRAARKAQKDPTVREQGAAQKELDAKNALRTVFRQLASALHPDREPDAQLRARKTQLMSEVNAAYERKDLNALLRIQLQAEMVDASKAALLSDAKLKAMCDLLAEQVKALEMDNRHTRLGMEHEFGYPSYARFDEAQLLAVMQEECAFLQNDVAHMQADLQRVQDDKELKAWLKEQTRASKFRLSQEQDFGIDMDDLLHAMMRRR
ncbi:MAG: hypothetical protein KGN32_10090 [Burkholderiales bacterium]|nr:hypothetical protein [Burkholderiales bacterium]